MECCTHCYGSLLWLHLIWRAALARSSSVAAMMAYDEAAGTGKLAEQDCSGGGGGGGKARGKGKKHK